MKTVLFFKAEIKGYTRADGVYVAPHSDRRKAAQHGQTSTPAFKKWFGRSKVVDKSGKPLVVLHGSATDFDAFDTKKIRYDPDFMGSGFHFDTDEYMAGVHGKHVKRFYLSIKKPVTRGKANALADDIWTTWETRYPDAQSFQEAVRMHLQSLGYDGVHFGGDHYVAFSPDQIKHADENNGEFSASHKFRE